MVNLNCVLVYSWKAYRFNIVLKLVFSILSLFCILIFNLFLIAFFLSRVQRILPIKIGFRGKHELKTFIWSWSKRIGSIASIALVFITFGLFILIEIINSFFICYFIFNNWIMGFFSIINIFLSCFMDLLLFVFKLKVIIYIESWWNCYVWVFILDISFTSFDSNFFFDFLSFGLFI